MCETWKIQYMLHRFTKKHTIIHLSVNTRLHVIWATVKQGKFDESLHFCKRTCITQTATWRKHWILRFGCCLRIIAYLCIQECTRREKWGTGDTWLAFFLRALDCKEPKWRLVSSRPEQFQIEVSSRKWLENVAHCTTWQQNRTKWHRLNAEQHPKI